MIILRERERETDRQRDRKEERDGGRGGRGKTQRKINEKNGRKGREMPISGGGNRCGGGFHLVAIVCVRMASPRASI